MSKSSDSSLPAIWSAALLVGVALLGAGLFWPSTKSRVSDEDKEKAAEYFAAAKQMEALDSQQGPVDPTVATLTRERHQRAKAAVDKAQTGPLRTAFWLKICGGVVAVVGVVGTLVARSD